MELLAVKYDSALDRVKRRVCDPIFKVVDLHALMQGCHIELSKSCVSIVLLHVGNAVLVKVEILAVATIMQGLESQEDVRAHGIDCVTPKEMAEEGTPYLASILLSCELLHMLPCA